MGQLFRQIKMRNIGTSAADFPDGSNFDSYDCIIGMNLANVTDNAITISVYIKNTNDFYIIKNMVIPSGSAYSFDGKINVVSGDRLWMVSSAANSLDAIVSFVDAISV